MCVTLLIMRHELAGELHELPVLGVHHAALHGDRDALVHLVTGHNAHALLPELPGNGLLGGGCLWGLSAFGAHAWAVLAIARRRISVRIRATFLRLLRNCAGLSTGLTAWLKRSLVNASRSVSNLSGSSSGVGCFNSCFLYFITVSY